MTPTMTPRPLLSLLSAATLAAIGCASAPAKAPARASSTAAESADPPGQPVAVRPFSPFLDGRWIGNGICYGPHRDGQSPEAGGASPTREQIREDLLLLMKHWSLLRMYAAAAPAENVLQLIRAEAMPIRIVLGVDFDPETKPGQGGPGAEELPKAAAANQAQVENAIRLANAYPEVVVALEVGNETQISWQTRRLPLDRLIRYVREVRTRTTQPVASADDFAWWATPESRGLARELDFLDVHAYAMWAGQQLEGALAFTQEKLAEVSKMHQGRTLVLGEFGWATRRHTEGEQAKLIKGAPGEEEQRIFHRQAIAWTTEKKITNLFFEAFDENWKGGPHPDEVEKHWGLYRADRTPKKAMQSRGSRQEGLQPSSTLFSSLPSDRPGGLDKTPDAQHR